jgi:V8-like Glu-specific endopeptidase
MQVNRAAIVRIKPTAKGNIPFDVEVKNGSGVVLHSDAQETLILTAAHVIDTIAILWRFPDEVNRACRYEVKTTEGHSFEAQYVAATEYQYPDIGLLAAKTDTIGEQLPTVPIAREASLNHGQQVTVLGYPANREGENLIETTMAFQELRTDNFESISLSGYIPTGYSGSPIFLNNEVVGIVAGGDDETTSGPSYLALRKMFTNWIEGSYVSHPYNLHTQIRKIKPRLHLDLPAIVQVPEHIRQILRHI